MRPATPENSQIKNSTKNKDLALDTHHTVTNPKKPDKVRVVFDCAAQFSGESLNDHLYTGPDILNSLIKILIRFRQERIAVVGDVEAMYHRVQIYDKDEQFLRFLWWKDGNIHGPIEES